MSYLRVLLYSCLVLLLVEVLHGQQATSNDEFKFYRCSCSVIQRALSTRTRMGVGGADDDYTAAAVACDSLKKAVDTSDPQQIQSAATNLHSILRQILWDVGCLPRLGMAPASPQEQLAALEKKTAGLDGKALFYKFPDLAKLAFSAGDIDKAEAYSEQLLQIAPQYPKDWNYGNAIYYGNFVLGRIAVQRGNLVQAGQYLLAAGGSPGSPQLNSFGPNEALAKELLDKGQPDVVLQYFTLCKSFWKMDYGKLDQWSAVIRAGGIPDLTNDLYQ